MSITFLKKYKVIEKIGEGTFSEVLKCQNRNSGIFYAGKRLKRIYQSTNEIFESPELIAMRKISRHPNILYMIEFHHDPLPGKLTLIFELMDMSLYDLIKGRKGVKILEQRVRSYLYQLLKGLDHLQKHGIFHRDIKPENILVKGVVIKLADLGSIRGIYSRPPYTEYISTRWYRSPECLLTTGYYDTKMDIWALGCVFYELLTLKPLFPGSDEIDQISKIHDVLGSPHPRLIARLRQQSRNCEYSFPNKIGIGVTALVPSVSELGKEVLKMMLIYDPESRSSVKRLLEHRYFYELRENDLERVSMNFQRSNVSPEASQWRNPVLLSYITSDKRRGSKLLNTRKTKHGDDGTLKIPRAVESTPNARKNITSGKLPASSTTIYEKNDKIVDKTWKRNVYSTKTDRLPIILSKNSVNNDVVKREIPQRIQQSYSSQISFRRNNNFYPNFAEKQSRLSFLPEITQKPSILKPAVPQQIKNLNFDGKRKTKLSTVDEKHKSIIHTRSPNLKSPAKKIAKHEIVMSFSSKTVSLKANSSKRLREKK